MRILVLEPNPQFGGGMEGFSLELSRQLADRGEEIVLVHDHDGDMLSAYRKVCKHVRKVSLTGFRKSEPLTTLKMVYRLNKIIRRLDIDVCYTSHLGYIAVGAILQKLNGRPWHYHLGLMGNNRGRIDQLALPYLGGGISPAEHTLQTWRTIGWPHHTSHVVRNWVDGDRFSKLPDSAENRDRLNLPRDAFVVGFVGRLVKEKGVEVLIDAFNSLPGNDFHLLMVGRGEREYVDFLRNRCNDKQRLSILPSTPEVQKIYSVSDVLCVPSIWPEPFPLVVLEVMLCGKPVICSNVGILSEVLGEAFSDLIANSGDVGHLADRIVHVRQESKCSMSRFDHLRDRALLKYGPKEPVSAYLEIFQKSLQSSH